MKAVQITLTALLTSLILVTLAGVTVWSLWPREAQATMALASHSMAAPENTGSHCQHLTPEHIVLAKAVVQVSLELNDQQQGHLEGIAATLENWREQVQAICAISESDDIETKLDSLQQGLLLSADAIGELKPQLSAFHNDLDAAQLERLHSFVAAHHGRHGKGSVARRWMHH